MNKQCGESLVCFPAFRALLATDAHVLYMMCRDIIIKQLMLSENYQINEKARMREGERKGEEEKVH